ncbi:MAG: phosphate/phosphite/phosphonate ABC transporter substrate-binding protein [Sulfurisoma sp.]|nr:phosphate/phosphite/phosphonate ABC transporter substrate-binding protein [Sulfurisoma sp.]
MTRILLTRFAALACLLGGAPAALAQADEMVFGIYPYLSPSQIVEQFTPLKDYLAKSLGQPLNMVSAPDFKSFIERTRQGEYDLIFTAPHMGRLAEKRDGYRRVAQTGYQIVILVLARKDGKIRSLDDLRGRTIAIGSKMSMTYQVVDHALRKRKMALEKEVKVLETPSFSNVPPAVMRGEAAAGGTATLLWDVAPPDQRQALQEIFRAEPTPGLLVLAHPRVGDAGIRRLQAALTAFKDTPEGAAYFKRTQQVDFRPIDDATMKRIDPFTAVLTQPD